MLGYPERQEQTFKPQSFKLQRFAASETIVSWNGAPFQRWCTQKVNRHLLTKYLKANISVRQTLPQKKVLLLMAGPLRGGGGVKDKAIKEKRTFLEPFSSTFQNFNGHLARRGGGLGLKCPAIERRTFFAAFLNNVDKTYKARLSKRRFTYETLQISRVPNETTFSAHKCPTKTYKFPAQESQMPLYK